MSDAGVLILEFLRSAWVALAGALGAFSVLFLMFQALKTASASVTGAQNVAQNAIAGGMGVLIISLFAFLGIPALIQATTQVLPNSAGCGPIMELSDLALRLLGGIGAIRMLLATIKASVSTAVGGRESMASALLETGEVIFGLAIASVAIPLSAHFLGFCSTP